jgi:hypothetical protein
MARKIGIEERYPPTPELTKGLMGAYFFVMSVCVMAHQWNEWWFWSLLIFGGIPWAGAVSNYFQAIRCRAGYNAAIDDVICTISPLCVEMVVSGPIDPQEFYQRYNAALIRLRPNSMVLEE